MSTLAVFLSGAIAGGVAVYARCQQVAIRADLVRYDQHRPAVDTGEVAAVVDGLAIAEVGAGFAATRRVHAMVDEYRDRVGDLLDAVARHRARIAELERGRRHAVPAYGPRRVTT